MWARIGSLQILSKHSDDRMSADKTNTQKMQPGAGSGEAGVGWGVGGGGGEGVGGCGHALATFKYSLNNLEMRARCE